MYRHSILFKLNILFGFALIATIVAAVSLGMHSIKKDHMDMFFKSRLLVKEMHTTKKIPLAMLKEFSLVQVKGKKRKEVLVEGTARRNFHKMLPLPMQSKSKRFLKHNHILTYQGLRYLKVKIKGMPALLLVEKEGCLERCLTQFIVFISIVLLLILMYMTLRKSLVPLKVLQRDIEKYGEGDLPTAHYSMKKDEVSLASNTFYTTVEKIEVLRNHRQLFIRNIFHELNTPVTKGKILTEIVDEPKTKKMLDSIFSRLASLLKQLAKMEEIHADEYQTETKTLRINSLIIEAKKLLYIEDNLRHNADKQTIKADFDTMAIVFKNLIDNAIKYGSDLEIIVKDKEILFSSIGEALDEDLAYYLHAFSKGKQLEHQKSFGLGLYIVQKILEKHQMDLAHDYKDGRNIFRVLL